MGAKRPRGRGGDRRLITLAALIILAFIGIGARLFSIQVVRADEYAARGLDQRLITQVYAPDRGTIFDAQGRPLAVTVEAESLYARPDQVTQPEVASLLLSALLDLDSETIDAKLSSESAFVYLARQLEPELANRIRDLELPGIGFLPEPKRVYPAGTMAAHVVGFVNIDGTGIEGLEYRYQDELAGRPGTLIVEMDSSRRVMIPEARHDVIEPAEPGTDLITTIDLDIQFAAENACAAMLVKASAIRCTAVVLDPDTGAVLAMAVLPSFDPEQRSGVDPDVLQNAAIRSIYEPGSTQKVITISAALEEQRVRWDTVFEQVPYRYEAVEQACESATDDIHGCFRDFYVHDPIDMTVKEIVTQSSNVGTIMIGETIGPYVLGSYIEAFGLGTPTGIDFSGEASGRFTVDPSCGSCAASAAIGYSVAVTPLQMASAYAVVANGGEWVQPHLVTEVVDGSGTRVPFIGERRRVLSEETARTMRFLLHNVVAAGTGKAAAVDGYTVGGKTGTAERNVENAGYTNQNVASFVGMAPIDDPRLVVAVVVDAPDYAYRTGGLSAAPVFAEIIEKALHQMGVPPDAR